MVTSLVYYSQMEKQMYKFKLALDCICFDRGETEQILEVDGGLRECWAIKKAQNHFRRWVRMNHPLCGWSFTMLNPEISLGLGDSAAGRFDHMAAKIEQLLETYELVYLEEGGFGTTQNDVIWSLIPCLIDCEDDSEVDALESHLKTVVDIEYLYSVDMDNNKSEQSRLETDV